MKLSKVSLLCAMLVATSFAGITINIGGGSKKKKEAPPPPPPRGELHERLCDRDNCCNFDVDGRSLKYTLRCDYRFQDADLYVGHGRRAETFRLYDHGRLPREISPREEMHLRINYPPPPPRPRHHDTRDDGPAPRPHKKSIHP